MTGDDLCTSGYPGDGRDAGQLCDQDAGHSGDHTALVEIAGSYRRRLRWTADGTVLPDIETTEENR